MNRSALRGIIAGVVVGAVFFSTAGALLAQASGVQVSGRSACVNIIMVFNEYQRQKDLAEEMTNETIKFEAEFNTRKQRIEALQATLDAMNRQDPAIQKKLQEQLAEQISFKNWGDFKQAAMGREVGMWTTRVYTEIVDMVAVVAQQEGWDLVLYRDEFEEVSFDPNVIRDQIRGRKLLYASPAVDLTQKVLEKLNAQYRAKPRQKMLQIP
jgi:Skp family chaperone for outer membrane proteins